MNPMVLMGNPKYFRIRHGQNPYTRNAWGFRKKVDRKKAITQWNEMKERLESLGARVKVLPAQRNYPGMVFPANAGFVYPKYDGGDLGKKRFYLSNLLGRRSDEQLVYHHFLESMGLEIHTVPFTFEGEADFFPCGERYIFTYGKIVPVGFRYRPGWPPWYFQFSHRSDKRNVRPLQDIVGYHKIIELVLKDTRYYHGDTALFAFGKKREYLLAYLEAFDAKSRQRLKSIFKKRLIPLSKIDAENFAANSFQLDTAKGPRLIMPLGMSEELRGIIGSLGFPVEELDVSEFFSKGGGSIKCMLCDLGHVT